MLIDAQLAAARKDYDTGVTNDVGFKAAVNGILTTIISSATDAEKIAAFDKIAEMISSNYQINELEDGIQPIKSDLDSYVFEAAFQAVLGPKIFDGFYNMTYEAG